MEYKERYEEWLSNPYFDEDTNKEYNSPYHQMVDNITGGVINDEMFDWRNW